MIAARLCGSFLIAVAALTAVITSVGQTAPGAARVDFKRPIHCKSLRAWPPDPATDAVIRNDASRLAVPPEDRQPGASVTAARESTANQN